MQQEVITDFPSLEPLAHDLPLLCADEFSVDDFLCSRTKASDLNYILSDLRSYSEKLKQQLFSIINQDYKDFVSLGSSLKAEAHRISRLGWSADVDGQRGLMAPIRQTLIGSKDTLRSVQDDIEHCMQLRSDAEAHKARLELMLQLHDSIARLQDLLLIGQQASNGHAPSDSNDHLSDYALSSDEEHTATDRSQTKRRRKSMRRSSLGSSYGEPLSPTKSFAGRSRPDGSSSLLGLPQRVARTSAEYSRLRFLRRRLQEEGLADVSSNVVESLHHIRTTLRQDLRTLLRSLLSQSSLLIHGKAVPLQPSSPQAIKTSRSLSPIARRSSFRKSHAFTSPSPFGAELDSWTQVAEPAADRSSEVENAYWQARFEEQRSWLEMVIAALQNLSDPLTESPMKHEALDAVRELMVQDWATTNIIPTHFTPPNVDGNETADQHSPAMLKQFAESQARLASILLPATDDQDGLVQLYNMILRYVATDVWQVCDAADQLSALSLDSSASNTSACDVFVNVVWDEISSKLLDQVGSQIFFVGRTAAFYRCYKLTNLFLQRFVSLAPSKRAADAVTQHQNWSAFRKRWQLPVYFQMRFREVITKLEESFVHSVESENGRFKATTSTVEAIETLWSDGVHIHELSAREWRVTLQILSRYKTWIEEQIPDSAHMFNGVTHKVVDTMQGTPRGSMDRASVELSRVGTPQLPTDPPAQHQEDVQLKLMTSLVCDCLFMRDAMDQMLDKVILQRFADGLQLEDTTNMTELRRDLAAVLAEESFGFVPGLASSAGRLVYNTILPRTLEPLRMLRSFPHRTTAGKSASSAMAQVVVQIFSPIQTYLKLATALPQDLQREWTQKILSETFKRFTTTVETNSKNQQSLNRLKKSQPPASGLLGFFKTAPAPTPSDAETVTQSDPNAEAIQMFQTKLHELQLGIDLDAFPAWTALKSFLESHNQDTP